MGEHGIRHLRLEPYSTRELGKVDGRVLHGVAIRTGDGMMDEVRLCWEIQLAAVAFRTRCELEGLEPVLWYETGCGGGTLQFSGVAEGALSDAEVEQFRDDVARAAAEHLDSFELLRPFGHAWVVRLRADEPHTYLRGPFREFLTAIRSWDKRCGCQRYLEVVDHEGDELVVSACGGRSCRLSTRPDVECCSPLGPISRPLSWRPRRCPVFD